MDRQPGRHLTYVKFRSGHACLVGGAAAARLRQRSCGSGAAAAELRRLRRALMRRAVAGIVVLVALSPSCAGAACISEPIDRSQAAEALRSRTIADFVKRDIIYKIVKTSATATEVQVTQRFLDLPFDTKQVVAWSVFSSSFDGADDKQTVLFTDSRT